ncbi:hypothetical protein F0M18_10040 [Pseudohalioglobus sediminis]|uniref:Uncharacterized protein n=1 Tax=Pseudohalioglobus sediminis TaxID=2606449 RepID=A0A5B0X0J7_9GAMM|nr:hypothetical protein [Pseudohalioglobus sediminis]KAA1191861.1 hypothetical protein F0M18_10040 [Pseudohalioglobus sediminis]
MSDQATQKYRLISGTFSPDDAREVLMTLIEDKIRYHARNNWSRRERCLDTDWGDRRIAELRQTKAQIAELVASAASEDLQLTISCDINVSLEPADGD